MGHCRMKYLHVNLTFSYQLLLKYARVEFQTLVKVVFISVLNLLLLRFKI